MYVCMFVCLFIRMFAAFADITEEPTWTFDVNYTKVRTIEVRSYVQLLATLRIFSKIVTSYVKRPHNFFFYGTKA